MEITGKRQYRIEDGRLLSVYDTDSSMYDDILGQALSEYSDHKLRKSPKTLVWAGFSPKSGSMVEM